MSLLMETHSNSESSERKAFSSFDILQRPHHAAASATTPTKGSGAGEALGGLHDARNGEDGAPAQKLAAKRKLAETDQDGEQRDDGIENQNQGDAGAAEHASAEARLAVDESEENLSCLRDVAPGDSNSNKANSTPKKDGQQAADAAPHTAAMDTGDAAESRDDAESEAGAKRASSSSKKSVDWASTPSKLVPLAAAASPKSYLGSASKSSPSAASAKTSSPRPAFLLPTTPQSQSRLLSGSSVLPFNTRLFSPEARSNLYTVDEVSHLSKILTIPSEVARQINSILDIPDYGIIANLSQLSPEQLTGKMKDLQTAATQLGEAEIREISRGKILDIFKING